MSDLILPESASPSRRTALKTGLLGLGSLGLGAGASTTLATTAEASSRGFQAMCYAYSHAGARYVLNTKGPSTFDCSGLVQYSLRQRGISVLPGSYQQAFECRNHITPRTGRMPIGSVPRNAQAGNLVFFFDSRGFPDHVGFWTGSDIFDAYNPSYRVGHRPLSMYHFSSAQVFSII